MNSDKPKHRRQRGNAMIYILLSLGLIGGLTAVMSNQSQQGGDNADQEQAELMAAQVINYASSARLAIEGMLTSGTRPEDISFVRPNEAGYGTGATINQFYHPNGGGFNDRAPDPKIFETVSGPSQGWYVVTSKNVAWTPTASSDFLINAYWIKREVCEAINKAITGNTTIPSLAAPASQRILFANYAGAAILNSATCPACVGRAQLCVQGPTATDQYTYYNIIVAR